MSLIDPSILTDPEAFFITPPEKGFEKKYIQCRTLEKRMYTDDEVKKLPGCLITHPHYLEWRIRERSFKKLYRYLSDKKNPLNILEIGCGNGWLLRKLSDISQSRLTGIDVNLTELQQASRIFADRPEIKFIYGDIRSEILGEKKFDIILFAASIQYFESLDEIVEHALQHLQPGGEIHIIDTKFYEPEDVSGAKQRSKDHFEVLGVPELAAHYFHHTVAELASFKHTVMYDPR